MKIFIFGLAGTKWEYAIGMIKQIILTEGIPYQEMNYAAGLWKRLNNVR